MRLHKQEDLLLKILAYGLPGSQKTRFLYSAVYAPECGRVLGVNCGGNPLSIRDYSPAPDILEVEDLLDLNSLYEWLRQGQPASANLVRNYGLQPPYGTLIFDGVTDLQRMSFSRATGNTAKGPGDNQSPAQLQHYGAVLAQMTTFARLFFNLPMHVMITALEREDKDEGSGRIFYKPLLLGQSAVEVASYAYVVARCMHQARLTGQVKEVVQAAEKGSEAVAFLRPSPNWMAKNQYCAGIDFIPDPTIPKLLEAIRS